MGVVRDGLQPANKQATKVPLLFSFLFSFFVSREEHKDIRSTKHAGRIVRYQVLIPNANAITFLKLP